MLFYKKGKVKLWLEETEKGTYTLTCEIDNIIEYSFEYNILKVAKAEFSKDLKYHASCQ